MALQSVRTLRKGVSWTLLLPSYNARRILHSEQPVYQRSVKKVLQEVAHRSPYEPLVLPQVPARTCPPAPFL